MTQESGALFVAYLLKCQEQDLVEVLTDRDQDRHYGVRISLAALAAQQHEVADALYANPRALLPLLDSALVSAQERLLDGHADRAVMSVKENVHARLVGLTLYMDSAARAASPAIGEVSSAHADSLITVAGTVVKTGPVKMLEARRLYECNKCRFRFVVAADLEMCGTVELPQGCPSRRNKPCAGRNFRHCSEVSLFTNYQELRVQEAARCLVMGGLPRAITVLLQDELADRCRVGDDVHVTGVVLRQFGPMQPGQRCQVSLALQATALEVAAQKGQQASEEVPPEAVEAFTQFWAAHAGCPLEGRNKIVASMCPQLFGLFTAKLAALLMLIGGVPRDEEGDVRVRGEVHMLLVGDPGTGKSQFQRHVAKLSSRAVMASGNASSAAGLTAAAVKDGAHWTLEAGALVLADGGVCCIDEFDGIRESDRASIHEAMEQQTCSIAKAGLVSTLHTRTTVFGTCNPRGNRRYNPRQPLAAQLNISGPLLSRFDLVLLLLDHPHPTWDEAVAQHILDNRADHQQAARPRAPPQCQHQQQQEQPPPQQPQQEEEWPPDVLRHYVQWVKATFRPALTPGAEAVLSAYYAHQRSATDRQASRTTVRMLESLVRLVQAHARLMARHEVTVQDAVVAVGLMEATAAAEGRSALFFEEAGGPAGHCFAEQPDREHALREKALLAALAVETLGGLALPR